MHRVKRFRPSAAMVVAFVALFVAMAGTATAARLITGKQIRNNSITSVDVRTSSLNGSDVRDQTLRAADFAPGQLPAGPRGDRGERGPQGEPGPFPDTLPSGKTVKGRYALLFTPTAANQYVADSISFGYRLANPPVGHYVKLGDPAPPQCPGSADNPQAAPGHLCVYEDTASNITGQQFIAGATHRTGAPIRALSSAAPGPGYSWAQGGWAVTGS